MIECGNEDGTIEEFYRYFWVKKDKNGEILSFEAVCGVWINDAIQGVKDFLRFNDLQGEYILIFNDVKLTVSVFKPVRTIIKEYLDLLDEQGNRCEEAKGRTEGDE